MGIMGFSFNKMLIERKTLPKTNINIKNDVSIKGISEADVSIGTRREKILKFAFEFSSDYSPSVGRILLKGELAYSDKEEKQKEILEKWKKNKKLKEEVIKPIISYILNKCNVQSIILSKDVNLPPPVPLPKIKASA